MVSHTPIKVVYLGSLSLGSTYLMEFCNWILTQSGRVIFDIVAYNVHTNTRDNLIGLSSDNINFFYEGVAYNELLKVLCNYDFGVVLNNAKSKNVKFCATNKLIEYLACGLTVLYSDKMLGYNTP